MGEQVVAAIWGCSSVGRAPALQAGGQEFESLHLHVRHEPCMKFHVQRLLLTKKYLDMKFHIRRRP